MANTPTTDLTTLTDANTTTGWADSTFNAYDNGNAANFGTDNLLYIQDGIAISQQLATNRTGGSSHVGFSGTDPAAFVDGEDVFFFWWNFLYPGAIEEYNENSPATPPGQNNVGTAAGYNIGIGSSGTAAKFFAVGGTNFGRFPEGGWQNVAIDPSRGTFAGWTLGSPTTGVYDTFGLLPVVNTAPGRGQANAADAIRWGRGAIIFTGGSPAGTFQDMADENDLETNRWGLFGAVKGGFLWKGKLELGTTATSLLFDDSDVTITIDETRQVYDTFNLIEINNNSSDITWTNITMLKAASAGLALDNAKGYFLVNDNPTVRLEGCSFTDMGTFKLQSSSSLEDTTFRRCLSVFQGDAQFNKCTFENTAGTTALTGSNSTLVSSSAFISDGSSHAYELDTTGTFIWENNSVSGYATVDGSTGNEVFYNNSGGAVTLNKVGGSGTVSVRNGTGASTTVNVTSTTTVTGLKDNTEVRVLLAGTSTELAGIENATDGTTDDRSFAFTLAVGTNVTIVVHNLQYIYIAINYTIPATNSSIPVQQQFDRNYSNP